MRALPGVGVTWWSGGGPRQAVSDANGVVSLGRLPQGVNELTVNTRSLPGSTGSSQPVLVALLLPAVQSARESAKRARVVQTVVPAGADLQVRIGVDPKGEVTSVNWFSGGVFVAAGDVNGDGRADLKLFEDLATRGAPGETRLVVVTPVNDAPSLAASRGGQQVATRSPSGPSRWSTSTALPGVNATLLDSSGRTVGRAVSDANGLLTFDRLPQGKYDLVIPNTGGNQPAPQGILIGLLLPAVQAVRLRTLTLPAGGDKKLTLDVGPNGEVTRLAWRDGGITADDDWEAPLKLGSLPPGVGVTRIALALDTGSVPEGRKTTTTATPPTNGVGGQGGGRYTLSVPVKGTGPGGVFQMHTDGNGVARLGKLPTGNTIIELSGDELRTALRTAGPGAPPPQKTLVELMIVVSILGVRTDGQPVVFVGTFPANAVPKTIKADLRIGRDNNPMTVNWGKGPQAPQALAGVLSGTLSGPAGPIAGAILSGAKPGDVVIISTLQEANNILMDVSTTR